MSSKNNIIEKIFDENGVLKKKNPLYKKRESQVKAACMIYESLLKNEHFIMESSTGFGKTLTFLTSSIQTLIDNPKRKIIIVTSNIALQEQLVSKDIPFVLEAFKELYPDKNIEKKIKVSVLKGINNFVCKQKYENFLDIAEGAVDAKELTLLSEFLKSTKTGDLSDIDFSISNSVKNEITTNSDSCNHKFCPHAQTCYSIYHKDRARTSNIIVTNYHMLFSSYLAGSSMFEGTNVMIFDEAHEIESILREYDAKQVTSNTVRYILNKLSELRNKDKIMCKPIENIDTEKLIETSDLFFNDVKLKCLNNATNTPKLINSQNDLPDSSNFKIKILQVVKIMDKIIGLTKQNEAPQMVQEVIEPVAESTQEDSETTKPGEIRDLAKALKKTCTQVIDMVANVDKLLEDENKVLWVEKEDMNVKIGLKNIDVSDTFRTNFLESSDISCILTSATLSVNNNFDHFKKRLGFNEIENENKKVVEFIGNSPFNLTEQQLWYLPQDTLPGNHPDFDIKMIPKISQIIEASNGGALCLFTSTKNMNKCKKELPNLLKGHTLLTQGDLSKKKILELFRDDCDSSLLATKSFFTGVDIPGHSLRVVIIDKLPFASPGDPIQQKLNQRDNAFFEYSLPEMIISLKQAVGRGVRTIDDKCVICILDERIATARYKRIIFNSMKYAKTSTRDIEVVRNFIRGNRQQK